ncbi:PepSY domain-containing protein [Sutcliffiella horikoshii]|uniref:PepSY domain-containing protein n=1 Tax=Sutcliffiella horikoshii TaxID=79883 RepID=UPI003850046F
MKNKQVLMILSTGAFLVLSGAAIYYLFFHKTETLATETEVRELVESQYKGSIITSLEQKEESYEVYMENDMGEYELTVDGRTNEITSLKLVNRKGETGNGEAPSSEEQEPADEQAGEQPEPPVTEDPAPSMLTRDEAIEIALKEVPGKVEDVELDEENGIKVYEVEMEVDEESEATIIINAYTGEILSLTWD